jgi:hypothetical protein
VLMIWRIACARVRLGLTAKFAFCRWTKPRMENAILVPANFRISQQAQSMLNELTDMASGETGRTMVPAFFWDEEYDEVGKEMVVRGIALGCDYRDEVPTRLLQVVDGITLIFAVSPKQALHFNGREIDYRDGRRFFLAD